MDAHRVHDGDETRIKNIKCPEHISDMNKKKIVIIVTTTHAEWLAGTC